MQNIRAISFSTVALLKFCIQWMIPHFLLNDELKFIVPLDCTFLM